MFLRFDLSDGSGSEIFVHRDRITVVMKDVIGSRIRLVCGVEYSVTADVPSILRLVGGVFG